MKIMVPLGYTSVEVSSENKLIAKGGGLDVFVVDLPSPKNEWLISGCFINDDSTEVSLVDNKL